MSLKNGETEYPFQKEFKYSTKGQFEEAKTLLLKEPKIQHARRALQLRQIIKRSEMEVVGVLQKIGFMDLEEETLGLKAGKEVPKIESMADQWKKDSSVIIEQLTMQLEQSSVDMYKFAETFWLMADQTPSICLIDGVEPMKSGLRDKISLEDFIGVPIWYCSFFVTLTDKPKKSISGEQPGSA